MMEGGTGTNIHLQASGNILPSTMVLSSRKAKEEKLVVRNKEKKGSQSRTFHSIPILNITQFQRHVAHHSTSHHTTAHPHQPKAILFISHNHHKKRNPILPNKSSMFHVPIVSHKPIPIFSGIMPPFIAIAS